MFDLLSVQLVIQMKVKRSNTKYVSCELILWMIGPTILLTANCWHPLHSTPSICGVVSVVKLALSGNSGVYAAQFLAPVVIDSSEGNIAPTTGPAWPWNIAEKPTHYWKLPKKDQRIGAPNHFSHATANCWQEGETNLRGQHQSNISLKQIFSRHIFYLLPKSRPNLSGILRLEARSGKTHIFGPRFLLRYLSPMPNKNPSITKSCDLSFSAAARVARTFWCTAHLIWPRGSAGNRDLMCGMWSLTAHNNNKDPFSIVTTPKFWLLVTLHVLHKLTFTFLPSRTWH